MGRKSDEPLDKRKNLTLYEGDWERLAALLQPLGVPLGVFLRQLVRKKIVQLEAAKNAASSPISEINPDDLIRQLDAQSEFQPTSTGES